MLYTVRPLTANDESFLWQMLYYAAHVHEEQGRTVETLKGDPVLRNYASEWGRQGDLGFVAEDGAIDQPVGAAWMRLPSGDQQGYSFVDEQTPELAVAVLPGYIGQGIGTRLLTCLLTAAKDKYPAVILSVRESNPARRLYERMGFVVTREITNRVGGRSLEMILRLEEIK